MGSLIRATTQWGYRELVLELGGDPDALSSRFGITLVDRHQDDAFIPLDGHIRLLEASADELDCPNFGLRLSQWQGLEVLGPIAVIARNAQTLHGAVESVSRYHYVHSPALTLAIVPQTAETALRSTIRINQPGLPEIIQGYEVGMANAVRIIRRLGGPDARPSSISFMHDQQGTDADYREALGCPVRFGQSWCGFELPRGLAERRIQGADPETRRIAAKYLDSNYLPPTAALSERVAELTRRLLPTGQCSADAIASQLTMHTRTMQRRLAGEGMRCQDVIDRERRIQAARYLAEPELQFGQIAGLLGYAEQSALNRSCRRWFGKTPRRYRAELKRPHPGQALAR